MKGSTSGAVWLLVALLGLTAGGAALLSLPACLPAGERELEYFWARRYWQAAFDACSAACGAGLLTARFGEEYAPAGRWALTGIGVLGATLFLALSARPLARLLGARLDSRRAVGVLVAAYLGAQLALAAGFGLFEALSDNGSWSAGVWNAVSAFSSLGWRLQGTPSASPVALAVASFIGAAGLPWVLAGFGWSGAARRSLRVVAAYAVFLAGCALLLYLLEWPRGGSAGQSEFALSDAAAPARCARLATITTLASGAGMSSESFAQGALSDASQMVLGLIVLAGGLPGAVGGGIKLPLLLMALAWLTRRDPDPSQSRSALARAAAARLLVCVVALTVVVALGMLGIERLTASRFQAPPTFADAFLDASSCVGGAALSSGLFETITSRNLVSGLQLGLNQYQVGMVWLMLAMLAGRVAPVLVLGRIAPPPPAQALEGSVGARTGMARPTAAQ